MRKILFFVLSVCVLLSACTMHTEVVPVDTVAVESEGLQNGEDADHVVVITSLEELKSYRENGVISEKHYNFYCDLLSGKSDVPAYNTIEITDFTIQFTVNQKWTRSPHHDRPLLIFIFAKSYFRFLVSIFLLYLSSRFTISSCVSLFSVTKLAL